MGTRAGDVEADKIGVPRRERARPPATGGPRANIAFNSYRCCGMRTLPSIALRSTPRSGKLALRPHRSFRPVFVAFWRSLFWRPRAQAQDDPLNKVHVPPPTTTTPGTPAAGAPAGAEAPVASGPAANGRKPGAMIRMNVDMVLVPVTVTDPMNRLVTGLEKEDFQIYENSGAAGDPQFASEDAPVSIGIIFDLRVR